jgi:hypothetical protein
MIDDSVPCHAYGHTYNIRLKNGQTRTRIGGKAWRWFLTKNRLSAGETIFSSWKEMFQRFICNTLIAVRVRMVVRARMMVRDRMAMRGSQIPLEVPFF